MQEFYDSDYTLLTYPGSSNWDSFEFGNELWRKIYRDKLEPATIKKRFEYLLKEDKNALYTEVLSIRSTEEFLECKILEAPGKYDFKPYAIGYQKHSPYAEMLDYHIEEMRESGVLDKIRDKYRSLPQQCPDFRFDKSILMIS